MKKERILLADSSRFFRTIESKFLQKTPLEIMEAGDEETTLELIRKNPPDLVFLAYDLAAAGEPSLCERLKRGVLTGKIPVVVICDQNAPEQTVAVRRMAADACLVKPLDRHSFVQLSRNFLRTIREYRQPSFFPVTFLINGQEHKGKCLDISSGGMFVESHVDVMADTSVELMFRLPDGTPSPLQCQATVTWLNRKPNPIKPHYPFGFGVKFSVLPDTVRREVMRLTDKLTER